MIVSPIVSISRKRFSPTPYSYSHPAGLLAYVQDRRTLLSVHPRPILRFFLCLRPIFTPLRRIILTFPQGAAAINLSFIVRPVAIREASEGFIHTSSALRR